MLNLLIYLGKIQSCFYEHFWYIFDAGMVKLVDTPDLGSGAARCESSSLSSRTIKMQPLRLKQVNWGIAKR